MTDQQSEHPQMSPDLTGRQLADYFLIRRLGRGGMADVYLAKQNSLNRNVALKILKPELAKDESYVKRFRQEAQAAAGLMQSNIVQIFEVGECEGFYFISQEYVQGQNLRQYLGRHGAVESIMAINVLRQALLALQEAARQSVTHRDIKPENIMLSTKGEVKVTDFGLARIRNSKAQQALTQIGVTMGTPLYMSPEQVEGQDVDHRSDIYSLGVTAYHMLSGSVPFDGDNPLSIALKHVKDEAEPLSNHRPDIPQELCDIVGWMMSKKRGDRPQDAKTILNELRKIKLDEEEDWDTIVEKLSVASQSGIDYSYSESKLAATRQLQSVMRGHRKSWWFSAKTLASISALAIAGVLGGWLFATQNAPPRLLNVENTELMIVPQREDARQQYESALNVGFQFPNDPLIQIEYFKAVAEYHSPEKAEKKSTALFYNRLAKARLSEIYLKQGSLDSALKIFDEFTKYSPPAVEDFIITGFAGRAIVLEQKPDAEFGGKEKRRQLISEAIGKVQPEVERLNDMMSERFNAVVQRFTQQDDPSPPEGELGT